MVAQHSVGGPSGASRVVNVISYFESYLELNNLDQQESSHPYCPNTVIDAIGYVKVALTVEAAAVRPFQSSLSLTEQAQLADTHASNFTDLFTNSSTLVTTS